MDDSHAPPASAPADRWLRAAWALAAISLAGSLLAIVVTPWQTCDFDAYHRAAVRAARGENPYQLDSFGIHGTYRYPPAFAFLMSPLGELSGPTAGRIWFGANVAMLLASMLLALSLVMGPRPWPARTGWVAIVALYACSFYNTSSLVQGQVTLLMTLLCLGWAVCMRAGRNFTGGVLLAGAAALKLWPVVMAPYLLVRRDWRGLAGVAVGGALFLLTPAPWVGFDGAVELHRDWLRHARDTQVPVQNYRTGNQGLMGMLARLPHVSNGWVCVSKANLAALDRSYPYLVAGLAAALYGWIAWDLRRRRGASDEDRRDREILYLSLLFVFTTVTHPCAWRCNYSLLLLPCVVLARRAVERLPGFAASRAVLLLVWLAWAWQVLLVAVMLPGNWERLGGTGTLADVIQGRIKSEAWSFGLWVLQGAHFWTALVIAWACWRYSGVAAVATLDTPGESQVPTERERRAA